MLKVSNIAAEEVQNALGEYPVKIVDIITAEEMKRILAAFKDSGDEFFRLESFGIFLDDYVVLGGEVTKIENNKVSITEAVISFMDFLWRAWETELDIPTEDEEYIIYFLTETGRYVCDLEKPEHGFEIAKVVVFNGEIQSITDTRGPVGGVRFAPYLVIDGGEW